MVTVSSPKTIERAYRMRAYPNATQRAVLARLGGATRWFWNRALDRRSSAYRADGTKLKEVIYLTNPARHNVPLTYKGNLGSRHVIADVHPRPKDDCGRGRLER